MIVLSKICGRDKFQNVSTLIFSKMHHFYIFEKFKLNRKDMKWLKRAQTNENEVGYDLESLSILDSFGYFRDIDRV